MIIIIKIKLFFASAHFFSKLMRFSREQKMIKVSDIYVHVHFTVCVAAQSVKNDIRNGFASHRRRRDASGDI